VDHVVKVGELDAVARRHFGRPPTLVLLHDAGRTFASWDDLLHELGDLDVLAPALPGRSGSQGVPFEKVAEMTEWLHAVLRKSSLERVILCGHGLGGAIALDYARRRAELAGDGARPEVVGLVLISATPSSEVSSRVLAEVGRASASNLPAEIDFFSEGADLEVIRRARAMAARTPPATAYADWKAVGALDRTAGAPTVDVSALVIVGTADAEAAAGAALAQSIPGASIEAIEGAGYEIPFEAPAAMAHAIRRLSHAVEARVEPTVDSSFEGVTEPAETR
jgi:pimeloyl-ACP methyl ester carboxylesterase